MKIRQIVIGLALGAALVALGGCHTVDYHHGHHGHTHGYSGRAYSDDRYHHDNRYHHDGYRHEKRKVYHDHRDGRRCDKCPYDGYRHR